jgi:hypothetical protein
MRNMTPTLFSPLSKTDVAKKLLEKFQFIQAHTDKAPRCFIGFDGFTDEIISVVDTRTDVHTYRPMERIAQLGERILAAAGKSCNIELVLTQQKLGGNAPILTNALLEGNHRITFVGSIGYPDVEPLFKEMADRCEETITLCPSAHSDALEFHDGKVILGKLNTLKDLSYTNLINQIGRERLIQKLDDVDLFVCANWTMLPMMTELWENLAADMVPFFKRKRESNPRWLFVDLADPAKRTDEDIARALKALHHLQPAFQVVLGLNEAEALRMIKVAKGARTGGTIEAVRAIAQELRQQVGLYQVVIHATAFAVVATEEEAHVVEGPYCKKPFLTTGAGDNFNAGYCNGLLYNLSPAESLLSGVSTSGYYVRMGKSPTLPQLVQFILDWSQGSLEHYIPQ